MFSDKVEMKVETEATEWDEALDVDEERKIKQRGQQAF